MFIVTYLVSLDAVKQLSLYAELMQHTFIHFTIVYKPVFSKFGFTSRQSRHACKTVGVGLQLATLLMVECTRAVIRETSQA